MARLNIAMLGEQAQEQTQVDSELEVVGNQVEDSLQQAQQAQVEIDQISGAADDAQQATEDLMQEAQAAEQAKELSTEQQQVALESIQRNVKNILKDIGLSASRGFAMESRKGDSKVALEGMADDIKSFIKKIWDKIKEVWNKVVDAIKGFLKNIFDAGSRLKKRAIKVKEAAKAVEGKEPKETTFDPPESVKEYMRLKNMPAIPEKAVDSLVLMQDLCDKLIDKAIGPSAKTIYEQTINGVIKEILREQDNDGSTLMFNKAISRVATPLYSGIFKLEGTVAKSGIFLSDRFMQLESGKITILKIDDYKDINQKYDVMYTHEINDLCDLIIKRMGDYEKVDKDFSAFSEFTKQLNKTENEFVKENSKEDNFIKTRSKASATQSVITHLMGVVRDVATKVRLLDLNVNKAAIDWCAASLKQY